MSAIIGETLSLFAPNKTARIVSRSGANIAARKSHHLILNGGNVSCGESAFGNVKSRPQNGHQAAS
jgi:hypothetical protein